MEASEYIESISALLPDSTTPWDLLKSVFNSPLLAIFAGRLLCSSCHFSPLASQNTVPAICFATCQLSKVVSTHAGWTDFLSQCFWVLSFGGFFLSFYFWVVFPFTSAVALTSCFFSYPMVMHKTGICESEFVILKFWKAWEQTTDL